MLVYLNAEAGGVQLPINLLTLLYDKKLIKTLLKLFQTIVSSLLISLVAPAASETVQKTG